MNSFSLADCTTVDAALSQLKNGAVVKAGGVDLLDSLVVQLILHVEPHRVHDQRLP